MPGIHEDGFTFPELYLIGFFISIIIGLVFISYFGIRFSGESKRRSDAINKVQQVIAKEYELESLGGQAAAAAHSLGTPLATINVVATELKKELGKNNEHLKDIDLLISQTKRCGEILKQISKKQGTVSTKTRSEVRGGGRKPWRQKGTGRARAGSNRSPLWRGGGVTFAATPRDYSKKINKKMYRAALRSIFSELLRQGKLVAIETPVLDKPKTKEIAKFLKDFSLSKVLFITDNFDSNFYLSARNIPNVDVITVKEINPVILLKSDKVAVTAAAFKLIEEWI